MTMVEYDILVDDANTAPNTIPTLLLRILVTGEQPFIDKFHSSWIPGSRHQVAVPCKAFHHFQANFTKVMVMFGFLQPKALFLDKVPEYESGDGAGDAWNHSSFLRFISRVTLRN